MRHIVENSLTVILLTNLGDNGKNVIEMCEKISNIIIENDL